MSGFVYFIGPEAMWHREGDEAVVKIGHTRHDPFKRMDALQAGSPLALEMYCFIEGPLELEKAFHETFAELRSHREWFYNMMKLSDFLGYLYEPPSKSQPVPRTALVNAVHDNIFATGAPHPSVDEATYLKSCDPDHLAAWFPELW